MSGTFELFKKPTTFVWVGVPSPSKIPNTLFCSTSWCTTLTVCVGLYSSFLMIRWILRPLIPPWAFR